MASEGRPKRGMRCLGRSLFVGCLIWLSLAIALDRWGLREPPAGPFDAIIVAGCRVMPDGRASLALAGRTSYAVELWRAGVAPRVVLTGGVGQFPPAEAEAAAAVARSMGVPEEVLLLETQSGSTEQNAEYAARLLGPAEVLVVSDSYHAWRCSKVFGRYFTSADAVGRPPSWMSRIRGALREVVAVGAYGATGRLNTGDT